MDKKALTIYKASAGSGKTFMLTRHYLSLALESENNYKHILAITFTRKATAEMRQRIIGELKLLSSETTKSEHAEYIKNELNISLNELKARSQKLLSSILHDYSNFSITTIDQFFQRIIRSLTRELGLPGGYRIEMAENKILVRAVEIMLDKTATNDKLFELLLEYVKSEIINENKSHVFQKEIVRFVEKMLREDLKDAFIKLSNNNIENEISVFKQDLKTEFDNFETDLKKRTKEFDNLLNQHNLVLNNLKNGTRAKYLYKTVANGFKVENKDLDKIFNPNIGEDNDAFFKKDILKELGNEYNNLYQVFINDCKYFTDNYPKYIFAKNAYHNLWHILFFANIWNEMSSIKQSENLFVIGDSAVLLSQIIDKNDTSFIFEKIANKFNHFLIDEFQDTSTLQWSNIRPFVTNSMSQFNPLQQKSRVNNLIVGDVKQAIYRFRNGNWNLLNEQVNKELDNLGVENHPLNNNYRSSKTIIEFNNQVFDILRNKMPFDYFPNMPQFYKESLASIYTDYKQIYPHESEKQGFVQIVTIDKENYKEENINLVIKQVLQMLDNGVQQGEIAILVRKADQGRIIAEKLLSCYPEFTKHKLQIAMSDVLSVDKSIAVNAIINTLKYLSDTEQEYYIWIAAWQVSQTLGTNTENFFCQSPKTLLPNEFFDNLDEINKSSLYDTIVRIIKIFKLNTNKEEIPFISRFLNFTTQFLENNIADRNTFLKYWEEESQNIKIPSPSTSNAIQIMTIHKSKGLEFKHVILPFFDWKIINSNKESVWIQNPLDNIILPVSVPFRKDAEYSIYKDLLFDEYFNLIVDSLNTMYVAFTRAKTSLSIYTTQNPAINTVGQWFSKIFDNADKLFTAIDSNEEKKSVRYSYGNNMLLFDTGNTKNETENFIDSLQIKTEISVSVRNSVGIYPKDGDSELSGIEYGTIMHRIMEQITTLSSLDKAVSRVAATGVLNSDEIAEVSKKIKDAISQHQVSEWFSDKAKIYNEHVLICPDGKLLRPDRIVETTDGDRILIDYKFTHEQTDEHFKQIHRYAKTLEKAGRKISSAYLWYMIQNKIVKVL